MSAEVEFVDTDTGEIVQPCSAEEARDLTDRIKQHAEALWELLLEAHDRGAWKALSYSTWADYVAGEFSRTKQWSYQLLDQGRAIKAIEEAAGSNAFDLTVNEARDVKPHLTDVTNDVREQVDNEPEPSTERVRQIVTETVDRYRDVAKREAEAREVMADVDPAKTPKQDPERVQRERTVINAINALADVADPYALARDWSPHSLYHLDRLDEARDALDAISDGRTEGHA